MQGENDDEVLRRAREHGQKAHNIQQISGDMERQLRQRIKNV
jgi:predicted small metal-binding protein